MKVALRETHDKKSVYTHINGVVGFFGEPGKNLTQDGKRRAPDLSGISAGQEVEVAFMAFNPAGNTLFMCRTDKPALVKVHVERFVQPSGSGGPLALVKDGQFADKKPDGFAISAGTCKVRLDQAMDVWIDPSVVTRYSAVVQIYGVDDPDSLVYPTKAATKRLQELFT
jgi:hypothetical protein